MKAKQAMKIERILDEFRGLKQIAAIKSCGRKQLIPAMTDASGVKQTTKDTIAEVFATFYKELYTSRVNGSNDYESGGMTEAIDHFTMNELREVIKILKTESVKMLSEFVLKW